MRYAFMSFSTPELTLRETLALAKRLGYDGIEPRIVANHKHGVELDAPAALRREMREIVAESGIAMCCIATSCQYAKPDAVAQQVDDTQRAIDLAGDLGVPCLRVFGGMLGEGLSREQAIDQVAGALVSVAAQAQARGVTVCMETHDAWCAPAHVAAVMRAVNHPSIAVNWDIMHPVRAGGASMDEAFETLKPWIRHLHVHDGRLEEPLTLVPIGEGGIDHRRALALLLTLDFAGYISGEWIGWEPYEIHLPRELATLRAYEAELTAAKA